MLFNIKWIYCWWCRREEKVCINSNSHTKFYFIISISSSSISTETHKPNGGAMAAATDCGRSIEVCIHQKKKRRRKTKRGKANKWLLLLPVRSKSESKYFRWIEQSLYICVCALLCFAVQLDERWTITTHRVKNRDKANSNNACETIAKGFHLAPHTQSLPFSFCVCGSLWLPTWMFFSLAVFQMMQQTSIGYANRWKLAGCY